MISLNLNNAEKVVIVYYLHDSSKVNLVRVQGGQCYETTIIEGRKLYPLRPTTPQALEMLAEGNTRVVFYVGQEKIVQLKKMDWSSDAVSIRNSLNGN